MKATPLRGYPVPECDPPLVKDASDIIQIKNLADAIDADIENLTGVANPLVYPVAGKMSLTGFSSALSEFTFLYTTSVWETRLGLNDPVQGFMVIPESGFYQLSLWSGVDSATNAALRTRPIVNGLPVGVWGGFSSSVATVTTQATHHNVNMFLSQGDEVSAQVRHNLAGANTYHSALHVTQLARS